MIRQWVQSLSFPNLVWYIFNVPIYVCRVTMSVDFQNSLTLWLFFAASYTHVFCCYRKFSTITTLLALLCFHTKQNNKQEITFFCQRKQLLVFAISIGKKHELWKQIILGNRIICQIYVLVFCLCDGIVSSLSWTMVSSWLMLLLIVLDNRRRRLQHSTRTKHTHKTHTQKNQQNNQPTNAAQTCNHG